MGHFYSQKNFYYSLPDTIKSQLPYLQDFGHVHEVVLECK